MYCSKYRGVKPVRCCLTLGKPDAIHMPHACKKCIDEKMAVLKPGELTIMWEKCRRLWKHELEEMKKQEEEEKRQRELYANGA